MLTRRLLRRLARLRETCPAGGLHRWLRREWRFPAGRGVIEECKGCEAARVVWTPFACDRRYEDHRLTNDRIWKEIREYVRVSRAASPRPGARPAGPDPGRLEVHGPED